MKQDSAVPLTTDSRRRQSLSMVQLRRQWLHVHRWLGLTVGLVFVLIGLTGSLLVFDHAIDEWLNPELLTSSGTGQRATVEQVIAAAEDHYAADALSVSKPRVASGVWSVWFMSGTEATPAYTAVYVDPFTAAVTGQRIWGQGLMSWIYRLHYQLVAGATGATVVGLIGLLVIASVLSGLYLWWPLWRHSWRSALSVRAGKRFSYDLHKVVGVASAVVLLALAFTGVFMEFHGLCVAAIQSIAPVTEPPTASELKSTLVDQPTPITADAAIAIASKLCPEGVFDHLHPPTGKAGHYEVAFRQPNEVQQTYGRSQVFLDQYTGEVLAMRMPNDATAADVFIAWQFPLHSGEAFGLLGRLVVFVSGLMPAALYVTGVLVWRRKSRKRIAAGTRATAIPPLPSQDPQRSESAA